MKHFSLAKLAMCTALLFTISACGGGGSDSGNSQTGTGGGNTSVVSSVSVTPDNLILNMADAKTATITATVLPAGANQAVNYTSNNPSVATAADGTVTAQGVGTAIITVASAEDATKFATVNVTVNLNAKPVTGVTLALDTPLANNELELSQTVKLTATIQPVDAIEKGVTFKSSDESKATVDANGNVTANNNGVTGDVTITVTTVEGAKTASVTINIIPRKISEKCTTNIPAGGFEDDGSIRNIYSKDGLVSLPAAQNARLMCNIVLNDTTTDISTWTQWTPIPSYSGTFDGDNWTISGLYINDSTKDTQGLFGFPIGATIKNVVMKDVNITAKDNVGAIAGMMSAGSLTSSSVEKVNITGTSYLGGVVGNAFAPLSQISANNVTINATGDGVGGIAGQNSAISKITTSKVTNSTVKGVENVGGIIGRSLGNVTLSYVDNVTVEITNSIAGGIAGELAAGKTIAGVFANKVEVKGAHNVGGLIGTNNGTLTTSYFTSDNDSLDTNGEQIKVANVQEINDNVVNMNLAMYDVEKAHQWKKGEPSATALPTLTTFDATIIGYDKSDPANWKIFNENGLFAFAKHVNADVANLNTNATLTTNIDLNNAEWTPIGISGAYTGTFDGAGYTISNLKIDKPSNPFMGMFSQIASGGIVRNFALKNVNLNTASYTGAIANNNEGTIENIYIENVTINVAVGNIGAVVATNSGIIENVVVNGANLTGSDRVGGIAGQTRDATINQTAVFNLTLNSSGANVGGIVGDGTGGTLSLRDNYFASTVDTLNGVGSNASATGFTKLSSISALNAEVPNINNALTYPKAIVIVAGSGETLPTVEYGYGYTLDSDGTTWLIPNAHGMYNFHATVEAGNVNTNARLTSDINFNNSKWESIGGTGKWYAGMFDGNGKTISGLNMNGAHNNVAMFYILNTGGTIKNLTITGANITGEGGTAVLVSDNRATIEDITITNSNITGHNYVGGVAAHNSSGGTISRVTIDGLVVRGDSFIASVVGNNLSTISTVNVRNVDLFGTANVNDIANGNLATGVTKDNVDINPAP